ncbi:adenosine deaminase-like isoform X2 [Ostrea edulis]|uniref:adenosine deaminase-like isoform X2 n=1 Tax=Ostrea edulis TaxID=37623 RepID=UPI0024AF505F|nr:adenosine deaminase-like isoform X2 [Ostrea edulis]
MIIETAKRRNIKFQWETTEELKSHLVMREPPYTLQALLDRFNTFMPVVAGDREALYKIAYDFCEDCKAHNAFYVEARYSPHLFANKMKDGTKPPFAQSEGDITPQEVVKIICNAFDKGSKDFGIKVKSILCCVEHRPEWSMEVLELCKEFQSRGVVAIDIACGDLEPGIEHEEMHTRAFQLASQYGIHRTVHAGESGPAAGIKLALDEMHAERIGHGYKVVDDPDLYERCRRENVHFEVCPLSSVKTGSVPQNLEEHPLHRFIDDEVNFSINTDDPIVLDNDLTRDYEMVMEMGLDKEHVIATIFHAARSCFASPEEKEQILKDLVEAYGEKFMKM